MTGPCPESWATGSPPSICTFIDRHLLIETQHFQLPSQPQRQRSPTSPVLKVGFSPSQVVLEMTVNGHVPCQDPQFQMVGSTTTSLHSGQMCSLSPDLAIVKNAACTASSSLSTTLNGFRALRGTQGHSFERSLDRTSW